MTEVIVRLAGGLGNQLFEYAAARGIAERCAGTVRLDSTLLARDRLRTFALGPFGLGHLRRDLPALAAMALASPGIFRIARRVGGRLRIGNTLIAWDRMRGLERDLLAARPARRVVLSGYWQNLGYFDHVATQLRAELRLAAALSDSASTIASALASRPTVGLHMRRGDFVSDSKTARVHLVCTEAYYRAGVERIAREHPDLQLAIFSDDPDWARSTLPWPLPTTVVGPDAARSDAEDLWLLSRCDHLVLSNSSFSWWAGWLGARPDRIVVCPNRWYAMDRMPPHPGLPTWIRCDGRGISGEVIE